MKSIFFFCDALNILKNALNFNKMTRIEKNLIWRHTSPFNFIPKPHTFFNAKVESQIRVSNRKKKNIDSEARNRFQHRKIDREVKNNNVYQLSRT